MDGLYFWIASHRNRIVTGFKVLFFLQILLFAIGFWNLSYDIGKMCGDLAVIFFVLVSVPGIARRFKISHKGITILMIFRRYIGIATYLFALIHAGYVRIIPWIAGEYGVWPMETSVVFGVVANILLFSLFVTSNDWSITKLGDWWGKIHDLTYVIVWIIFLHLVFFDTFSFWSFLIGITSVAQVSSHIYAKKLFS